MCDLTDLVAQLGYYSLYGRSAVVGCSAVRKVEQLSERPKRLVNQWTEDTSWSDNQ